MRPGDSHTVSVVIPVYQGEGVIEATLRSVLAQTFDDLEVIVVDDGSTDATASVLDQVAATDSRLRVERLAVNGGRSAARNRGMSLARGRWVTNSDADDLWAADRLERLLDAASRFPSSRLITDDAIQFRVAGDGRVRLGHRFPTRSTWWIGEPHRVRVREWYLDMECPMRPLIRADLLAETGATYPVELSAGEDLAFQLELVFTPVQSRPVRVARPGYYYREGESLRAPNQAQSRLRLTRRVAERTGSTDFVRWARRSDPGRLFLYQRADRQFVAAGRTAPVDPGTDEVIRSSVVRGYGRLAFGRALQELSKLSDRGLRAGIVADIERQLRA